MNLSPMLPAIFALLAGCDVCGSQQECGVATGTPCHPKSSAPYPATGCGTTKGSVIDDIEWTGRISGLSTPTATLALHDYYNPDGTKPAKFMFITVSAFWCQACKDEAKQLNDVRAVYGSKVVIVTDLAQKLDKSPADQGSVDAWVQTYALETAVVTDPDFALQTFFDPSTMPLDLIIDLKTMTIVYKTTGAALPSVMGFLDSVTK